MLRKIFLPLLLCLTVMVGTARAAAPDNFRSLYTEAGPAVVNINTETVVERRASPFPFPSPFDDFFRNQPGNPFGNPFGAPEGNEPRSRQRGMGSGFIISEDGYIVTNYHVIDGADEVTVTLSAAHGEDLSFPAEVIGGDQETDLALLKIEAEEELPCLDFGDSDSLEVGDWVVAIGNPFGLDHTLTAGILSAKGRNIRSGPFDSFLQTDASINPGNSGGPLLNLRGEVVGINTAIIAGGQGIGFAIPSNMARSIVDDLRVNKRISRGWLGVTIQNLDEAGAKALGLDEASGALISDVMPEQPAAKAGLQSGDVITEVNGKAIENSDALLRSIANLKPGDKAGLTVWRNGESREFTATLAERGADPNAPVGQEDKAEKDAAGKMLGITLRGITRQDLSRYQLENTDGLLVASVEADGIAAAAGLRRGDVVLGINGAAVESLEDFNARLEDQGKKRGAVMLQISRQGQKLFLSLEIQE